VESNYVSQILKQKVMEKINSIAFFIGKTNDSSSGLDFWCLFPFLYFNIKKV